MLAALGFLLSTFFLPIFYGGATTPRWALAAVLLPILLLRESPPSRQQWSAPQVIGLLIVAWGALSLLWTSNIYDGIGELAQWIILAQAFLIGARAESLRPFWLGLAIGLIPSSLLAIWQALSMPMIVPQATVNPSGLFISSAILGETAALALVAMIALRGYVIAALIAPCILLTASRNAGLAIAVVAIIAVWRKSKGAAIYSTVIALAILLTTLAFGYRSASVIERFDIWRDTIDGLTWPGHGIGSYYNDYPFAGGRIDTFKQRPEHAHNDILELAFELGCIGIVILACWAYSIARLVWRGSQINAETCVLIAFAVEVLFGFPLHMPVSAVCAALAAGHLTRDGAVLRRSVYAGRVASRGRIFAGIKGWHGS